MLRIAARGDVPAMLDIYAPYVLETTITFEYTVPTLSEFTGRFDGITEKFPWLVYEENGEILGYAYASAPFVRAAYSWCAEPSIYLRKDARGKGIGKLLYTALEAILILQGFQVSFALVTHENEASLRFHRAFGYATAGVFHSCGFKFGRWLDLNWLEKRFTPVEIPSGMPTPWSKICQNEQMRNHILDILSLPETAKM